MTAIGSPCQFIGVQPRRAIRGSSRDPLVLGWLTWAGFGARQSETAIEAQREVPPAGLFASLNVPPTQDGIHVFERGPEKADADADLRRHDDASACHDADPVSLELL